MPDRHKHSPIRFRPSEANRERIAARNAETGKPVNAILNEALDVFWQAGDSGPATVAAAPKTVGPRAEAVGPRRKPRASAAPPVVLREPGTCPPHPKARVLKGLCGACGRQVGSEKVT